MNANNTKTFAIKTLGCKVNQYESQVIRENMQRLGFTESESESADLYIINSCTVTEQADIKTKKLIRRIKRRNPGAKVFVTGCYAVLEEDIEKLKSLPEVDEVVPGGDKMNLPLIAGKLYRDLVPQTELPTTTTGFSSHTRAFIKIQDGCNQNCAYCKVHVVRGPSRSRDEKDTLEEAKRLVSAGYKEIVMTGICLGSWKGSKGQSLSSLLREIDKLSDDLRIRLSSIEPNHVIEELIETIASSNNICRHLHVPLQSGSDRILKLMNRRYTSVEFTRLINSIRGKIPLAGITMDVIVGFPGETEQDFDRTMHVIKDIRPSRLHVFSYSDRKGTRSSGLDGKISPGAVKERVSRLISLGKELQKEFCSGFIGHEVQVLVEAKTGKHNLCPEGYTAEYVRTLSGDFTGREGDIVTIMADHMEIEEEDPYLVGKIIVPEKENINDVVKNCDI